MTKYNLEARILRQITHYPQFRGVARVVLKKVMFEGSCGDLKYSDLFEYISQTEGDFLEIAHHFKSNFLIIALGHDDLPTYYVISYGPFFTLLEMYVRKVLLNIIANFPADHFREECQIFLKSDVDFF